ncbi:MAG: S8 family serine peptidase [Gracilimonas sp.]|nr:S8 family serine peptidase [Gracilimonas sp.]
MNTTTTWLKYIYVILFLGLSATVYAQNATTTFNDRPIKENSIIVKYEDKVISFKGMSVTPQALANEFRTEISAVVRESFKYQKVEEWLVSGNMKENLEKLNSIPGVTAFPNYIFYRDEMEIKPVEPQSAVSPESMSDNTAIRVGARDVVISNDEIFNDSFLFYENFNDSAATVDAWAVESLNSSEEWELINYTGTGDYKFLAGDIEGDYLPNSNTTLYSPLFDFTELSDEYTYSVVFQHATEFDTSTSDGMVFYIGVGPNQDNSELTDTLFIEDTAGEFITSNFDITEYAGLDNVWFAAQMFSDSTSESGLGATFDNFGFIQFKIDPVDDPLLDFQYALDNTGSFNFGYSVPGADISAFNAWQQTTGSEDAVVVVFDDGVDFTHDDLANQAWINPGEVAGNGIDDDDNGYVDDIYGWSPVYQDNSFLHQESFHGTHVAGIIGAEGNNNIGISGVSQDVSIISVMIFDEDGSTNSLAIIRGYEYISSLLDAGVEITAVNQSWGGGTFLDYASGAQFVKVMTDYALHHNDYGTLWVISAGNASSDRDQTPFYSYPNNIQSPNVLTVASTDDADRLSVFSDFGIRTVDIGAPGTDIVSTLPDQLYAYLSGTSMAAPQVTGAIALAKSLYPDESGHQLMVRTLAGADYVPNLDGLFGEGTRLNASGMLDPSAEGISDELVASHATAYFQRTQLDQVSYTTVGFINNSDNAVTVSNVSVANNTNFGVGADVNSEVVGAGEAFAVPILFNNNGEFGEFISTATITTSAGNVVINLNGKEQGFPEIVIDPEFSNVGPVPYGTEIETAFNLFNGGNEDLEFSLSHELFQLDGEGTEALNAIASFEASEKPVEKIKDNKKLDDFFDELTTKVLLERGDKTLPKITYEPSPTSGLDETSPELVFYEDFESPDSVAQRWNVYQIGEGDTWEIADFEVNEGEPNNVYLLGDFENGYQNNSLSVATPPVFDFRNYEIGRGPAYLAFDVAVEMENIFDNFYVNVLSDGSRLETIVSTGNGTILNNGEYYRVYIDITHLAGLENIEFWFIGNTDGGFVGGFGALIDNVEIVVDDLPYFTSVFDGVVAPGEQQEISLSIRTDLLEPGDYFLFTDINSNSALSYENPGVPFHTTYFESRNVNLSVSPFEQDLGEVDADAPFNFSFDASNVGLADVDYFADVIIMSEEEFEGDYDSEFEASMDAALERFSDAPQKEPVSLNLSKMKEDILKKAESRPASIYQGPENYQHRLSPSLESIDIYFEDFESGELSEDWLVVDWSLGLGSVFEVENFGSQSNPSHMLYVGEFEQGASLIFDNTFTDAYSPVWDLTSVPSSDDVILEFDYSYLLEPGFDVGYVFLVYGDPEEGYFLDLLGTSEDILMNDGGFYRMQSDISQAKGFSEVYLVYRVVTDGGVQSAWALFDNIDIYTQEKLAYLTPDTGVLETGQSQTFEGTVNANWLYPGDYTAISYVDYLSGEFGVNRFGEQYTYFSIPNNPPVAENDEIAILSGDTVPLSTIIDVLLSNDSDAESEIWLEDISEPLHGDFKYRLEEEDFVYVAPLNYEGYDDITYVISDGDATDTASVTISIYSNPEFVNGSDKQYVFLEDESLTLSTVGMAAGVGGLDQDLLVWGESSDEDVSISHDGSSHTISFTATEDFFGQTTAMFHVGYDGEDPISSMEVSIVVIPVNDAPVAKFATSVNGGQVDFTDQSADPKDLSDGGIVKWEWSFGDGNTSEDRNPTYSYAEIGTYEVSLTVTDNGGLKNTVTNQVEVLSVVSNENNSVPLSYALEQNYPNPFNPTTRIKYSLPEASKVSIVIYDLLGKKVAELVNAQKSPGSYTLNFDASNLTSGIYIYQIKAGSFTETKKMTLIK